MAPTCCWSLTTSSSEATTMSKATAVLFGIEDEFDVRSVDRLEPGQVKIVIEMRAAEAPCPSCGVVSRRVKDQPLRIKGPPGIRPADSVVVVKTPTDLPQVL